MFKVKIYRYLIIAFCFLSPRFAGAQYETVEADTVEINSGDETTAESHFNIIEENDTGFINERHIPPEQVSKLKQDKAFWYVDLEEKKKEPKKENKKDTTPTTYTPIGEKSWVQTLLWILIIGGFAAALIWYLASNQVNLFRRKNVRTEELTEEEEMPDDIFAINYQREIDKAAAQGNFRLAVRLLYLRLLKLLSDREVIRYKHDLTNFDYLMQLQPSKHYNHFFRLTRHYEYSWYGHFEVDETQYRQIRSDFDQMDKEVQHS